MAVIKQLKDSNSRQQIFPKTTSQAVYNPDGTLLKTTLDSLYGSIATIETSPTVSAHAVGEYIVWQGQLYKVTQAISVGDNLTVGTNITATSVGTEIGHWTYVGHKTGGGSSNYLEYPATATELIVNCSWVDNLSYAYSLHILVGSGSTYYSTGYYNNSTSYGSCIINHDRTNRRVYVNDLKYNNQDVLSSSNFELFYK